MSNCSFPVALRPRDLFSTSRDSFCKMTNLLIDCLNAALIPDGGGRQLYSLSFLLACHQSIIFLVKSFLGNFYRHLGIFSGHTRSDVPNVLSNIKAENEL